MSYGMSEMSGIPKRVNHQWPDAAASTVSWSDWEADGAPVLPFDSSPQRSTGMKLDCLAA